MMNFLKDKSYEKSKQFLIDMIGKDQFNELENNNKIEISSNRNIYELYSDGRITNRTTNQSYCIIPKYESISYPQYDILAIKYAWLKWGNQTTESVAIKTRLYNGYDNIRTTRTQIQSLYDEFIHLMEIEGWYRNQLTINESHQSVNTFNAKSGYRSKVIEVKCPIGGTLTTKGVEQVSIDLDGRLAHRLILNIEDSNGHEIDESTKIIIEKIKPSGEVTLITEDFYSLFSSTKYKKRINKIQKNDNELYRWRRGVIMYSEDILRIYVVNPNIDIVNVKFQMECDLFYKQQTN